MRLYRTHIGDSGNIAPMGDRVGGDQACINRIGDSREDYRDIAKDVSQSLSYRGSNPQGESDTVALKFLGNLG